MRDLWNFIRIRKKWVLVPIILVLLSLTGLVALVNGVAASPFIYTIF